MEVPHHPRVASGHGLVVVMSDEAVGRPPPRADVVQVLLEARHDLLERLLVGGAGRVSAGRVEEVLVDALGEQAGVGPGGDDLGDVPYRAAAFGQGEMDVRQRAFVVVSGFAEALASSAAQSGQVRLAVPQNLGTTFGAVEALEVGDMSLVAVWTQHEGCVQFGVAEVVGRESRRDFPVGFGPAGDGNGDAGEDEVTGAG